MLLEKATERALGFGCRLCSLLWDPHVHSILCQSPRLPALFISTCFSAPSHERGMTEVMQRDVNPLVALEEACQGSGLNLIHYPLIPATGLVGGEEGWGRVRALEISVIRQRQTL